jgi:hypothetical protein
MTMAGPLRGPRAQKEAASPPLTSGARRACYGAAPPASRVLRIALRATAPAGLPLTPETSAAPGGRKSGQARPAPATRAARKPRGGGAHGLPGARERGEQAFDSHKERENCKPREASRIKRG